MMCLSSFLATVSSLPIPFLTNYWAAAANMWLLLFFGGFSLPILTGVMLSSVPPELRT
jgi:hypothetical protein